LAPEGKAWIYFGMKFAHLVNQLLNQFVTHQQSIGMDPQPGNNYCLPEQVNGQKLMRWITATGVQTSVEALAMGVKNLFAGCEMHIKHPAITAEMRRQGNTRPPQGEPDTTQPQNFRILIKIRGRIIYLEELWIAVYWFMREVAMPQMAGHAAGEQPPTPAQRTVRDFTRQNYEQNMYNPFNKGWGGGGGRKGGAKKGGPHAGPPAAWTPTQPWGGWTHGKGGYWGQGGQGW
jgi:hypothetical protein